MDSISIDEFKKYSFGHSIQRYKWDVPASERSLDLKNGNDLLRIANRLWPRFDAEQMTKENFIEIFDGILEDETLEIVDPRALIRAIEIRIINNIRN